MIIKTQNGALVNSDHITGIMASNVSNPKAPKKWLIQAFTDVAEDDYFNLGYFDTEERAQSVVDIIYYKWGNETHFAMPSE